MTRLSTLFHFYLLTSTIALVTAVSALHYAITHSSVSNTPTNAALELKVGTSYTGEMWGEYTNTCCQ